MKGSGQEYKMAASGKRDETALPCCALSLRGEGRARHREIETCPPQPPHALYRLSLSPPSWRLRPRGHARARRLQRSASLSPAPTTPTLPLLRPVVWSTVLEHPPSPLSLSTDSIILATDNGGGMGGERKGQAWPSCCSLIPSRMHLPPGASHCPLLRLSLSCPAVLRYG